MQEAVRAAVEAGVSTGFQLATAAGPLCDEPMWGVAFEVRPAAARHAPGATLCGGVSPGWLKSQSTHGGDV